MRRQLAAALDSFYVNKTGRCGLRAKCRNISDQIERFYARNLPLSREMAINLHLAIVERIPTIYVDSRVTVRHGAAFPMQHAPRFWISSFRMSFRRSSGASREWLFRAANLVQLRNTPSILVQSWRAQRGVPLFLRRVADPTRHLIDGDDA